MFFLKNKPVSKSLFILSQNPKKEGLVLYSDKPCEISDKGGIYLVICYVLINAAPTHEHDVYNKLSKMPEIIELHPLFGEYDLIAKIEADDLENLEVIVANKIRPIDGVIDTKTLTGTKFY